MHWCAIPVLLGIQWLEVVHGSGYEVTWKARPGSVLGFYLSLFPLCYYIFPNFSNQRMHQVVFPYHLILENLKSKICAILIIRLGCLHSLVTYLGCRQTPEGMCEYSVLSDPKQCQAGPSQHCLESQSAGARVTATYTPWRMSNS